jgi:hypothetical protein
MNWTTNDFNEIEWKTDFEITSIGVEISFDDLEELDKEFIIKCLKDDFYHGTFNDINWSVDIEVTSNGKKIPFDYLNEVSKEYIFECLTDNITEGNFVE